MAIIGEIFRPTGSTILSGTYTVVPNTLTEPWEAVSEEVADDDSYVYSRDANIEFNIPISTTIDPATITRIDVCCRAQGYNEVVDPTEESLSIVDISCVDDDGNSTEVLDSSITVFYGDTQYLKLFSFTLSDESLTTVNNLNSLSELKVSFQFYASDSSRYAYLMQLYLKVYYDDGTSPEPTILTSFNVLKEGTPKEVVYLTIPEGNVVKIIKTDTGAVLWDNTVKPITLNVTKISSDTYAANTSYTAEDFILLDIYPKSGGTVTVSYEGLTKTITDDGTSETPNAQQVFFGTFNGVTDEVETPYTGILTIEGDCSGFGTSSYKTAKVGTSRSSNCILGIINLGNIVEIPSNAFDGCNNITSVKIPYGASSIGIYAFKGCDNLTNLKILYGITNIGLYSFSTCNSLIDVVIPPSVTAIGAGAFQGCSNLASVSIPSSVENMINPFMGCHNLYNISIDEDNQWFMVEDGCVYSKDKTAICFYPTAGGHFKIPEDVTSIDLNAFQQCKNLTDITIPNSVTSIGASAFSGCSSLTSVKIPEGVTTIDASTFAGCSSLTSVIIPNSVTSITLNAFNGCSSLTNITIPGGVTSIGASAFKGCSSLTNITIPEGVTTIDNSVFSGCSSLTSVTIPEGVTTIGNSAFYGCSSLASVTVPSSVTSIGSQAFYLDEGTTRTITMLPTTPPTLSSNDVFNTAGTNNIVVPAGCGDTYKAAEYWSTWADYITEAS